MTFGLVSNGSLIFIFIKNKELWKLANIMIFNLIVTDMLNLMITAPLLCIFHYPHNNPGNITGCRIHTLFRQFATSLSAISLVALSIQRFVITVPSIEIRLSVSSHYCSPKIFNTLYVVIVWIISLLVSLPLITIQDVYFYLCGCSNELQPTKILLLIYFLFYCIVLPSVMIIFSVLTARRLRRSVKEMPCELRPETHQKFRLRSATIVTTLAVLFVVSHLPFWSWSVTSYWLDADRTTDLVIISECVTKYFLFLDSCFNPVALYIASNKFRLFFKQYFCCKAGPENDNQSVMTFSTSLARQLSTSEV
ncbi:hypothetical protein ANN_09835 [Periplaneta americana]|uniref:G-protein coupled receptors family 1 profile domain-containing protein n=1 Tax=Periplaneta americana TaxID=6978 RepID=A0ABQ8TQ23_PERAM|nr:hypothetical protein ANN_09835 [Periplaneta americana]